MTTPRKTGKKYLDDIKRTVSSFSEKGGGSRSQRRKPKAMKLAVGAREKRKDDKTPTHNY